MTQPTPTMTPLTPEEIRQADIEAWRIVQRTGWNQYVTATRHLVLLGAEKEEKLEALDKSISIR